MATDSFNDIIQKVGDVLTDACRDEWESLELVAEITNNYTRFTVTSTRDGDVDFFVLSDQQSLTLDDLFRELQAITKEDGMDCWNEAVFILNVDGNFNIDFRYDDDDDGGGGGGGADT